MALTDMVIMPGADYQDACDAVREKTGGTEAIKSGDLGAQIRAIPSGGSVEPDICTVTLDNYSLSCDCPVVFLSAMVFEDGAYQNFVFTRKEHEQSYKATIPNVVCGTKISLVSSFYTGYNAEPLVEITGSATFAAWEAIESNYKYMRLDFIAPTVANEDCTIGYAYNP